MSSIRTIGRNSYAPPTTLQPADPPQLCWQAQQLQLEVARRAHELFEQRNCEHGHDWDDWFQAETELLYPANVQLTEFQGLVHIRANVVGFAPNEVQVSLEPSRVTILGRKMTQARGRMLVQPEPTPNYLLKVVKLEHPVNPHRANISLQEGVLTIELPLSGAHAQLRAA